MSIKGSPNQWFEAAVRRGDFSAALAEVSELPRPLSLGRALGLVVVCGDAGDPRHGRWAARWAGRLAVEHASVDLAVLSKFVALLRRGGSLDVDGRRELARLAERHGAVGARVLVAPNSSRLAP